MNADTFILRFAGAVVLISAVLAALHTTAWLYVTGFVGFMMFQSSFTGFCPMAWIIKKLGVKPGAAFK